MDVDLRHIHVREFSFEQDPSIWCRDKERLEKRISIQQEAIQE